MEDLSNKPDIKYGQNRKSIETGNQ